MTGDLRALADLIQNISGIVVADAQRDWLLAALARVDPGLTPGDVLAGGDPGELDRLIDEVAIKETFFLRHLEELDAIDWHGKSARAAAACRPLRVWSAGCSTGEESYSLALLAIETLGLHGLPIDVLGTDLSSSVLAHAERGRYGTRSTRLIDDVRRERWFCADGARLRVGGDLRSIVRFARHNLVQQPFPPAGEGAFDLIVCRNVLIYFDWPTVARVTAALQAALAPGGRLLLGAVDRLGAAPPAAPVRVQAAPEGWPAGGAHAAFETGSLALSQGDAHGAVNALRHALLLDPRRAVVALQLARAHEAVDNVDAARHTYRRALSLVDGVLDQHARLYDHIAAGDVAAVCRARLAALPSPQARSSS